MGIHPRRGPHFRFPIGIFLSARSKAATRGLSAEAHFQSSVSDRIAGASPVGDDELATHHSASPRVGPYSFNDARQSTHASPLAGHCTNKAKPYRPHPPRLCQ